MKSLQAELAHIVDVVNRLSLAHPEVSFILISDGRQLTQTSGTGTCGRLLQDLWLEYCQKNDCYFQCRFGL